MKTYIRPKIDASLYLSESIALEDIMLSGDFADSSMFSETAGDTQW